MSGRKQQQQQQQPQKPSKQQMTANLLGGLGMEQIEEGLYGKVEEDQDLERELHALLGGGGSSEPSPEKHQRRAVVTTTTTTTRTSPSRVRAPPAGAGAASAINYQLEDEAEDNDEDIDVDEDDPELLQELQGVLGSSATTSTQQQPQQQQQQQQRSPTPPRQRPPQPANVQQAVLNYINQPPAAPAAAAGPEILGLLELRMAEYRSAAGAAKAAGQSDEALDLLRTYKQFEAAIEAVKAGQTVDPDDVPGPPPPLLMMSQQPTPPPQPKPPQPQQSPTRPAAASGGGGGGGGGLAGELAGRQAAYKVLQDKAKEAGDSSKARRMGRLVAQYGEALAALKAGAAYEFAGLPPPPGFDPLPAQLLQQRQQPQAQQQPQQQQQQQQAAAAAAAMGGKAGAQLRHLLARQLQYRQAAVAAKRRGDLATAKRLLGFAKGCEPMVQAAQAGLPVDLGQLPPLPGEAGAASASTAGSGGGGSGVMEVCEAPKELQGNALKDPELVYQVLEKTLNEKLAVAEENMRKFKSMGQIATADRWAKLARSATADLDYLLGQKRLRKPPPKFTFLWQSVSAVRCNPDLGENTLEVRVINGISLPVPDGFKESDLETQVKIELPISTEAPLAQSTGWAKSGGANPSYDYVTRFEVNRKARSTARVFKTRGLKFDVVYKRGFLKKDGLLGSATMKLDGLDSQCTLHQGLDLVEGRKAIGGRLEVQVRLREPMAGVQTDQVREQWLVIEHTNQDLPASRQSSAAAAASRSSAAAARAGGAPDCSAYVLQYEIGLLKPHCAANPKAAQAVRGLEQRLAAHRQAMAACSGAELRQYCSVLQQLATAYGQHAKAAATQQQDRGKAEKLLHKKKEAEREFQDVSSRLR